MSTEKLLTIAARPLSEELEEGREMKKVEKETEGFDMILKILYKGEHGFDGKSLMHRGIYFGIVEAFLAERNQLKKGGRQRENSRSMQTKPGPSEETRMQIRANTQEAQ